MPEISTAEIPQPIQAEVAENPTAPIVPAIADKGEKKSFFRMFGRRGSEPSVSHEPLVSVPAGDKFKLPEPTTEEGTPPHAPHHSDRLIADSDERVSSMWGEDPIKIHGVEVYRGASDKMDVFNNGENGQDRAVTFQLKMGEQRDSFVLNMDPSKPNRVINLENVKDVFTATPEELKDAVLFHRIGNDLLIGTMEEDQAVSQEDVQEGPVRIHLNDQVDVELLSFEPTQNAITIHKTKPAEIPIPIKRRGWKKLIDVLIGPALLTTAALSGGGTAESVPILPPPPIVENVPSRPPSEVTIVPEIVHKEDPRLKCDTWQEYEIKDGDSLTQALMNVNTRDYYSQLDPDGNVVIDPQSGKPRLNLNKLYVDVACEVAKNLEGPIKEADPEFYNAVKPKLESGSMTADELAEILSGVNTPPREDPIFHYERIFTGMKLEVPVTNPALRSAPAGPPAPSTS